MNRLKRLSFLFVTLALLCSSIPIAQAQEGSDRMLLPLLTTGNAGNQATNGLVVSKVVSPAEQRAALAMWTRAAIAAARPLETAAQVGTAQVDAVALAEPGITGPSGSATAGAAAPDAEQVARAAYPEDWALLEQAAAGAQPHGTDVAEGTSQIYTSYWANKTATLQTLYPHRWVGRLSFTTPTGTSYCSATSLRNNVLLTAAHCIYDTTANRFYSKWVFTPAYRNGAAPYGTFPATTCRVLAAWVNLTGNFSINTWARHDVAVCNMGRNSAGVTLNGAVGWMGYQWNQPYIRHFHDLGYPFRNYNDQLIAESGNYLHACVAESFQQTTETRGLGCNMSRGKSGGPVMVGYAPGALTGAADGVYSGFFIGTRNMYAPRFNSSNIVPLCTAAGC
jgi:V8-like Glu-specific endopeptidase